ncbi:hypothetical protein YK48G_07930 [Lentilactobacillus fungorum]|uniref:Isochorismatase family protein n=1 Tax=Lentilactobacillus fungorum TaxID=2201250 RepID=A0ABQ3VWT3_9LACO|nr:hypothetical protein YK48G_07930 [Lentilactobacillus fungorum]
MKNTALLVIDLQNGLKNTFNFSALITNHYRSFSDLANSELG